MSVACARPIKTTRAHAASARNTSAGKMTEAIGKPHAPDEKGICFFCAEIADNGICTKRIPYLDDGGCRHDPFTPCQC